MSQNLTSQAINELAPNAEYTIIDGVIDWQSEDIDQPSNEAIEAKKLEVAVINARALEYPQLGEQFDKLWHDINNGTLDNTGEFFTALKEVKDNNPKPGA
jgi:hypothetical protein